MGSVLSHGTVMSEQAYLDLEQAAEMKSEFIGGEVFAMAGATPEHNLIASNFIRELGNRLLGRCRVLSSDQRIWIPEGGYVYPDVTVVCGPLQRSEKDAMAICNPSLLVEVLSPSTEVHDRGLKFDLYRRIDSLHAFVLASTKECRVEAFLRQPANDWLWHEERGPDAVFKLPALNLELPLAGLFAMAE